MKTIHWNVDTQYDFMRDDSSYKGMLPIPGAREIESNLEKLTKHARENGLTIVNTADWHDRTSEEISSTPDYQKTFPPHCLKETKGARFVPATKPKNAYIVDWDQESIEEKATMEANEIVMYKDRFNIFETDGHEAGNPHADRLLKLVNPDRVVVYGVATNVCVDYAVRGLLERGKQVYVITDAIKELPGLPLEQVLTGWKNKGAKLLTTKKYMEGKK